VTAQVFISHDPAEAAAYVDGLSRCLAAHGIPALYEREIGGDQRWAQVVELIRACPAVVVVMTPGAERSPWVSSQVTFAQQLGKPILPLLLGGAGFAGLAQLPSENVTTGAMPPAAFVTRLRSFLPYLPSPAGETSAVGAPPAPAARRTGLVVGIVAAAVVGLLVLVCVTGVIYFRIGTGTAAGSPTTRTWQEPAAAIPGIHHYSPTKPESGPTRRSPTSTNSPRCC
jgi:hypothetical protein